MRRRAWFQAVPEGLGSHSWLAGDLDGDGADEILVGHSLESGRGGYLRVLDPTTGKLITSRIAVDESFVDVEWGTADFISADLGSEIIAAGRRRKTGAGSVRVFDGSGAPLALARATPTGTLQMTCRHVTAPRATTPSEAAAQGGRVLVGYQRGNESWNYGIWEVDRGRPRCVASEKVVGDGYEVREWLTGNFDGKARNGDEVVAVFTDLADRSIGFVAIAADGTVGDPVTVLDGNYIEPRATVVKATEPGRDDVLILARRPTGRPTLVIWSVDGIELLRLDLLSSGVR
jgi:hypothetical protein